MTQRYWLRFGNTDISVEDLCLSIGTLANGQYPGVCQHCGKTGIRYIAHVRQNVADTLARSYGEETASGGAIDRSEEEQDALSIALLEGKEAKVVDVGCVCVAKYFEDCGVDAGLAARAQEEVSKIMHILQDIASLESDCSQERAETTVKNWYVLAGLRRRYDAIRPVRYWEEPTLAETAAREEFFALRSVASKDYDAAMTRWKREAHGYDPAYALRTNIAPSAADLQIHYRNKIAVLQRKLDRFRRAGEAA